MNCLSWNVCGLGNPCTVQELSRHVLEKDPGIVFFMETRSTGPKMEKLRCKLQFRNMLVIPRRLFEVGLALFWKNEVKLTMLSYSNNHVDAAVSPEDGGDWRFTGFYGEPEASKRDYIRSLLGSLAHTITLPWVYVGEFNEIMKAEEKKGWHQRPE